MGSKYRAKFTDDPGYYTWIVDIIDTQYESYTNRVEADGGTVLNIECLPDALLELVEYRKLVTGPNGFDLIYGSRGDDAFKGVKGSRVNLTFIAEDSTDLTFLHAVAQTQEDRYFIQIQRNGSLFWQGVVLQDLMRIPYNAFPFAVEFQATCGLGRLEGIEEEIPTNKFSNFLTLITYMLGEQDSLTASTDEFIRTSVRWFEDQMHTGTPPDYLDALGWSITNKEYAHQLKQEDGTYKYRTWYDLLECIMHTFGARIFYAEGVYNIIQISEYANSPSKYNVYQKNYSLGTSLIDPTLATGISSTATPWNTFINLSATGGNHVLNGSEYGYLPAIGTARVEYNFDELLAPELREWIRTSGTEVTLGVLPDAGRYDISFEQGNWKVQNSSGSDQVFRWRQTARVKFETTTTTYYLNTQGSGYVWQTTPVEIIILANSIVSAPVGSTIFSGTSEINGIISPLDSISFGTTAPLPDNGTLYVRSTVTLMNVNNTSPHPDVALVAITSGAAPNLEYKYRGTQVIVRTSNTAANGALGRLKSFEFESNNVTLTTATEVKEYPEVFIGDAVSTTNNTNGEIKVYNVTTGTSEKSADWNQRGTGSGDYIHALKLKTAMGIFEIPRRLFDIKYRGGHPGFKSFYFGNKLYIWNYLKTDARAGRFDVEAYEAAIESTIQTVDIDDVLNVPTPYVPAGSLFGKTIDLSGGVSDTISVLTSQASGTVTSLNVGELNTPLGYKGDIIRVLRLDGSFDLFTLTENALQGATSISVESTALTEPIEAGAILQRSAVDNANRSYALKLYDITRFTQAELLLLEEGGGFEDPSDIQAWLDFSAGGHNFSAVDVAMTEKGKFATIFNGTSSYLANSTLDVVQPFTIAFAINLKETNTNRYILHSDASTGKVFDIYTGTGDNVTIRVGATSQTVQIARNEWVIFQLVANGASSKYRQNLDSYTSLTLGTDHIKHPVIGYDGSSNFCEMDLTAVCIFERVLTDDELDGLFINLEARI